MASRMSQALLEPPHAATDPSAPYLGGDRGDDDYLEEEDTQGTSIWDSLPPSDIYMLHSRLKDGHRHRSYIHSGIEPRFEPETNWRFRGQGQVRYLQHLSPFINFHVQSVQEGTARNHQSPLFFSTPTQAQVSPLCQASRPLCPSSHSRNTSR